MSTVCRNGLHFKTDDNVTIVVRANGASYRECKACRRAAHQRDNAKHYNPERRSVVAGRVCTVCGEDRQSFFYGGSKYRPGKPGLKCKPCAKRLRRPSHDAVIAIYGEYTRINSMRFASMKMALAEYGLSVDDYLAMAKQQNGLCLICRRADTRGRLSVDHDHRTGLVRGLLCRGCNSMLGAAEDDPARLKAAARYLRRDRLG